MNEKFFDPISIIVRKINMEPNETGAIRSGLEAYDAKATRLVEIFKEQNKNN